MNQPQALVDPSRPKRCTIGDYSHLPEDDRPWIGVGTQLATQHYAHEFIVERALRCMIRNGRLRNRDNFASTVKRFDELAQFDR